jgi:Tol biopolymer transport system component
VNAVFRTMLAGWSLLRGLASPLRGHSSFSFDLSPDGSTVLFTAAGVGLADLYLLDLGSGHVSRVARTPAYERDPVYAPSGRQIVYAASATVGGASQLFLRSLDSGEVKQLTTGDGIYDACPSYSADGSQIVFARAHRHRPYSMGGWTWDRWDLYVVREDGSGLQRLTNQHYYSAFAPELSPDGKAVYFTATSLGGSGLDVLTVPVAERQVPTALTTDGHSCYPSLSPDGTRVAFISDREHPFDYELYLMDTDGTAPVRLTRNHAYNLRPLFTPDGKRILFLSDPKRALRYELWEVELASGRLRRIADSSLFDRPLSWKPRQRG